MVQSVKVRINNQDYTLSYNSGTGAYEAEITAPSKSSYNQSGHYYAMTVTAYDDAGNHVSVDSGHSTFGDELKLYVKEKTKPVITVTYPTSGSTITSSKPTISWKVSDADSGINESTIALKIDNVAATATINKVNSGGTWTCTCTQTITDGSHTLTFSVSDHDGNNQSASVTFKVDTVPPQLNISSPTDNLKTNDPTLTVSGTTNDATSSPVKVTVNGAAATVQSNGKFEKTITLSEGENSIKIIATDSAGKSTTVTRTVCLDTTPPTITSISLTPNPVNVGGKFKISVVVSDE